MSNFVQLTDDIQHVQLTDDIQHVQLTDDIQHVQLTDGMIQRSFDRYEIESDEDELQVDYTAGNMNQRSDKSDEEEYWYSVEQERMKEEYWHLVEQLQEEHGANIPTEDHL